MPIGGRIRVSVHTTSCRSRQLRIDVRVQQFYAVITRSCRLLIMKKPARHRLRIAFTRLPRISRHGKKHNILKVGSTATRLMGMAETVQHGMVIMVTRSRKIGIRSQLHHPEGYGSHRYYTPRSSRTHHRTDVGDCVKLLFGRKCHTRHQCQKSPKTQSLPFHGTKY